MQQEIIIIIITAVCSGSMGWLFTLRWTRKKAESEALSSVQDIYQEIITDLKTDRSDLNAENRRLREENTSLRTDISDLRDNQEKLRKTQTRQQIAIDRQQRLVMAMAPKLCSVEGCQKRELMPLPSIEEEETDNKQPKE